MKACSALDFSPAIRKANAAALRTVGMEAYIPLEYAEAFARSSAASEKKLQGECESWLSHHGYLRLTAENTKLGKPARGWFGHLVEARRNPLLLDLFILGNDGRFLMVELKTSEKYRPGQRELIALGMGCVCRKFDEFTSIVEAWEE